MTSPNLVELWEEHCRCEFEKRDVNATMATMVPQPYVNHIPTMTGGVGYEQLKRFYAYHFIPVNPPDFALTLVCRTIGADTLVDEFILKFTHTTEIDWMLPGIPSTSVSFNANRTPERMSQPLSTSQLAPRLILCELRRNPC